MRERRGRDRAAPSDNPFYTVAGIMSVGAVLAAGQIDGPALGLVVLQMDGGALDVTRDDSLRATLSGYGRREILLGCRRNLGRDLYGGRRPRDVGQKPGQGDDTASICVRHASRRYALGASGRRELR